MFFKFDLRALNFFPISKKMYKCLLYIKRYHLSHEEQRFLKKLLIWTTLLYRQYLHVDEGGFFLVDNFYLHFGQEFVRSELSDVLSYKSGVPLKFSHIFLASFPFLELPVTSAHGHVSDTCIWGGAIHLFSFRTFYFFVGFYRFCIFF